MLTVLFIHLIAKIYTIAAYMLIHYSWEPIILFFRTRLRRFYECFSVYTWIFLETELWLAVKKRPTLLQSKTLNLRIVWTKYTFIKSIGILLFCFGLAVYSMVFKIYTLLFSCICWTSALICDWFMVSMRQEITRTRRLRNESHFFTLTKFDGSERNDSVRYCVRIDCWKYRFSFGEFSV